MTKIVVSDDIFKKFPRTEGIVEYQEFLISLINENVEPDNVLLADVE